MKTKEKYNNWQREYNDKKRAMCLEGLIKCEICGKYYKFLAPHLRQTHGVGTEEYKEEYGINRSRGLITKEIKEKKRFYVKEVYPDVIQNNLIKKGDKTRFKKGDKTLGKYERRLETMRVLKQQSFVKKSY